MNSSQNPSGSRLTRLLEIVREVEVALLTTVRDDGTLHTRPMTTRFHEGDNDLWFFTPDPASKTHEIRHDHEVGLGYADPKRNLYACISGTATVVRDDGLQQQLWTPPLRAWFPGGHDDPDLALLRVRIRSAEYWDAPPGGVLELVAAVRDELGAGQGDAAGDHQKIEVKGDPS